MVKLEAEKLCPRCSEIKKSDELKSGYCKSCARSYSNAYYHKNKTKPDRRKGRSPRKRNPIDETNRHLRRHFGITLADFNVLLVAQNHGCAICSSKTNKNKRQTRLCVDHCHTTGKIRGLLCDSCNKAIGLMSDDPNLLTMAISYLKK